MKFNELPFLSQANILTALSELDPTTYLREPARFIKPVSKVATTTTLDTDLIELLKEHGLPEHIMADIQYREVSVNINLADENASRYPTRQPPTLFSFSSDADENVIILSAPLSNEFKHTYHLKNSFVNTMIKVDGDVFAALHRCVIVLNELNACEKLIDAVKLLVNNYDKAMALPESLIETIATFNSVPNTVNAIAHLIVPGPMGYRDDNDQDVSTLRISRKQPYSFSVAYDVRSENYLPIAIDVCYNDDESTLDLVSTFNSVSAVILGRTPVSVTTSTTEVISIIVELLQSAAKDDTCSKSVKGLINYAIDMVVNCEPYVETELPKLGKLYSAMRHFN